MFRDGIAGYGALMKQLMANGGRPVWETPKIIPSDDPMLGIKKKRFFESPRTDPRLSNTRTSDYLYEDNSQYDNMDDYSTNGSFGTTNRISNIDKLKYSHNIDTSSNIPSQYDTNGFTTQGMTNSATDDPIDKTYIRTEYQIDNMNDKFNFIYILLVILIVINIIIVVVILPVVMVKYFESNH